jgi:hypothetical protein
MELVHVSTCKMDGVYEVTVRINGERYDYLLRSEEDVRRFEAKYFLAKKMMGRALAYLKQAQVEPARRKSA